LKTAGSCDVFCKYDSHLCVADYKTSKSLKKEEWIKSYFLQSTAYAMMIEERYNLEVPYIAILIAVEDDQPQVFFKRKEEYVSEVMTIFKSYHLNHSIL
jgi:ATP-dependent exoDNAse (exonuclease V) beta subunit